MPDSFLTCALVSVDADLREALQNVLGPEAGLDFVLDVAEPFTQITPTVLDQIHEAKPEIVFVDIESNPQLGVRFAHTLHNLDTAWKLVAIGPPEPSPDLVLEAMRSGISEYLVKPVTDRTLAAAMDRLGRERLRARPATAPATLGEMMIFFGVKGGSGSTTIATNVAVEMHRISGKKTVLVDLDFTLGEVALHLKLDPRFDFVDLANNLHRMESGIISSFLGTHESGLHVIVAPREPDKARGLPLDLVEKTLAFLRKHYDYVVVDGTNGLDTRLIRAMDQAQRLFLVLNVDLPSLRNVRASIPLLERTGGKMSERLALVVNRYRPDALPLSEVERVLGMEPYFTLDDGGHSIGESIDLGKPIVLEGKGEVAKQLRILTSRISGVVPPQEERRSWFGRRRS